MEMQIANQQFLDIPKDIVQLPVHELRSHLLSASSAYLSLLNHNKSLKDKLQQVALQVQDLEKVQEELLHKQNSQMLKQRELQEMQSQKLKEKKYDQIIVKQEQVIGQLQDKMEKVVLQKMRVDQDSQDIDDLQQEIMQLQDQVNQAQYGVKDEQGQTGEERQIDAIENGSIPQLRSLLEDLQTQLSENMENPMV